VQIWMQRFIVDPGADRAVHRANERAARRLVRPSAALTPVDRVAIYRGMYLLRMEEALAGDFPALKRFLGDRRFMRLVAAYVKAHPSRSYTLSRLRDRLPAFVSRSSMIPRRGFAADLARLELAMCEVFDEEESPVLSPGEAARLAARIRPSSRIVPIAALRLIALRWPANEYLQAFREGRRSPRIALRRSWIAVFRREGMVWRLALSRRAFEILGAFERGRTVGAALRAAGSARGDAEREIFGAFRRWASEGILTSIDQGKAGASRR
jgi:hypothetical protein